MRRLSLLAAFALLLPACGSSEDETLPTAEESQGLNEAAAMLDEAPAALNGTEDAEVEAGVPAETGDVLVADTNGQ